MPPTTGLEQFLGLSCILTGQHTLDSNLGQSYFDRLRKVYPQAMAALLTEYAAIAAEPYLTFEVKRRIVDTTKHEVLVRQIIRCWFTSEFFNPNPAGAADPKSPNTGSEGEFFSGMIWDVIEAHAPARSRRKYGYWSKRPPREKRL